MTQKIMIEGRYTLDQIKAFYVAIMNHIDEDGIEITSVTNCEYNGFHIHYKKTLEKGKSLK